MLTLDKIYHASYVLKDVIRQTNIVQARGICDDCDVYLKPENLQITGSFKVRGSGYKISQLTEEEKARGVIACSAGCAHTSTGCRTPMAWEAALPAATEGTD